MHRLLPLGQPHPHTLPDGAGERVVLCPALRFGRRSFEPRIFLQKSDYDITGLEQCELLTRADAGPSVEGQVIQFVRDIFVD